MTRPARRVLAALPPLLLCALMAVPASADPAAVAAEVRAWRQLHEQQIVDGFAELLSIPNVASDEANIRRNAQHIRGLLAARGFSVRMLRRTPGRRRLTLADALCPL
jgi:hypothetical protein